MSGERSKNISKKRGLILFLLMFALIFARYCCYGFTYWRQLDDYIQYHNYTAFNTDLKALMASLGLMSLRPLAGLADLYVWSHFYNCMIWAVAIISAMYAASAVLFHKVFSRRFHTGYLFFIVYALLPLGIEGTYWVSASSRIVVGLFFAAASLYFFDVWCRKGRWWNVVLFAVFQFAAFCLYEQIVLLSGAATLVLMIASCKGKSRRYWAGLLMFVGAAAYLVITRMAPQGAYSSRAGLFLPWQDGWLHSCAGTSAKQIFTVFVPDMRATVTTGLKRGAQFIVFEHRWLYLAVSLILSAGVFLLAKSAKQKKMRFAAEFFTGLFLLLVPMALFFVLKNPWYGVRNAVPSFLGLALMTDSVYEVIFHGKLQALKAAIIALLCLCCCVASVSEMHDYRATTQADASIASQTAERLLSDGWQTGDDVYVLNVNSSYAENANFYFHEHIYGVTSSDWAISGAVQAYAGREDIPNVIPLASGSSAANDGSVLSGGARFYYYGGGTVESAKAEASADSQWTVSDSAGKTLGRIEYSAAEGKISFFAAD